VQRLFNDRGVSRGWQGTLSVRWHRFLKLVPVETDCAMRPSINTQPATRAHQSTSTRSAAAAHLALVTGVSSGAILTAVLDALSHASMRMRFATVKVSINDQHYVMEGGAV